MSSSGRPGDNEPWAWLGLLKWSLQYSDGTTEMSASTAMSEEDKAFLESVMKEGIIDENERMKFILKELTTAFEEYQTSVGNGTPRKDVDHSVDLLEELRDIVEQIDYARAFSAMGGLEFLLGCVQETEVVPAVIRMHCLGILSTLSQNNPPVQIRLLELESIRILSELYFVESSNKESNGSVQANIIQALSSNVRNHVTAEEVFSSVDQSAHLLEAAVSASQAAVKRRALFFLRALVTSDNATLQTVRKFSDAIACCVDNHLGRDKPGDLREMTLDMISEILNQKKSVDAILNRKNQIIGTGVESIPLLRAVSGEEREYVEVELELWEKVICQLARAEPDARVAPLMIGTVEKEPNASAAAREERIPMKANPL